MKNPTLIAGSVPEGTGNTRVPQQEAPDISTQVEAIKQAVLAAVDRTMRDRMREFEIEQQKRMVAMSSMMPTRREVQKTLEGIVQGIERRYAQKEDIQIIQQEMNGASGNNEGITREEARQIAREAVPSTLRDLDSGGGMRTGNVLLLSPGGASGTDAAYWGQLPPGGISAEGDEVLYKGIFLREYDENGTIVAAGSEINPADYATQALYEAALTAAGHTLKPTWDWLRVATQPGGWTTDP